MPRLRAADLRRLLAAMLIVAASSALAVYVEPAAGLAASALVFVLGVMSVGALYGLVMAIIAAFCAFLIYNVFLTEPFLTLRMSTNRDVAPLVAFNLAALIAGVMAGRLQDRARAARRSNLQLTGLLEASEALQSALRPEDVARRLAAAPSQSGAPRRLYLANGAKLDMPDDADAPMFGVASELWGSGASAVVSGGTSAQIVRGAAGPIGVVVVPSGAGDGAPADPAFVSALASLSALALDRAALSGTISEAQALARSEELKTALLSSVSHDVRTPLAAISASASSLIDYRDRLGDDVADQLLRSIVGECEWLNRYTANLLEMSKLQAGETIAHAQVIDVLDMLGAALQRARGTLGARLVTRDWPVEAVLVRVDASLFELVLFNVLDNAAAYSEDGSRIEIRVACIDGDAAIDVRDEGVGLAPGDHRRIFERFQRGSRPATGTRGSGLGLAIAKGFVEAFDGRIWAETPGIGERGACLSIRIPLARDGMR